ncbi:neuritin 1-like a [Engraulis encrasicolus]|uniref:neuritin 1-like a n=1 Tax=Engraulis encrasicolus TaxID=184585 RepID=UPI002FD45B3C
MDARRRRRRRFLFLFLFPAPRLESEVTPQMLMPPLCSAGVTRKCGAIFQGFATCLLALGDSLSQTPTADQGAQEIDTICRSWDEFHSCANTAMAGCPEDAAAVWESLRQESKKMQFSGNLYDMCTRRAQQLATTAASNPAEPAPPADNPAQTNQESLKGGASPAQPISWGLLSSCVALLLLLMLHRI